MSVKVDSSLKAQSQPQPAAVPSPGEQPTLVELMAHKRYAFAGMVYEKGVVYTCDTRQADTLLSLTTDAGFAVFRKYKKPEPVYVQQPVELQPKTVQVITPVITPTAVVEKPKQSVLEIGTDDELRELGLVPAIEV